MYSALISPAPVVSWRGRLPPVQLDCAPSPPPIPDVLPVQADAVSGGFVAYHQNRVSQISPSGVQQYCTASGTACLAPTMHIPGYWVAL